MNYWTNRRYYFTHYGCFGTKRKIGRVYCYEPWTLVYVQVSKQEATPVTVPVEATNG